MKLKSTVIAAAIGSLFAVSANAAVPVFVDNFDSHAPLQLNWAPPAPSGWTVTDGTVDLIGPGLFDLLPGNGHYIDLDGSTSNSGLFSNSVNLTGGITYTLSFDLAGSQRGTSETVNVIFGSENASFSLNSADPFSTYSMNFTPGASGSYNFSYQNSGGDNVGILLDNVSVSPVPEPETYAMLLAGLGLLGFAARRRKVNA